VDQQGADADLGRHRCNLEEGVSNKRATESPTLLSKVHAESGEDDDWDRIAARARRESLRRVLGLDRARAERVVAGDRAVWSPAGDVDTGRVGLLRLECVLAKPARLVN
jgi:hypothetical protein